MYILLPKCGESPVKLSIMGLLLFSLFGSLLVQGKEATHYNGLPTRAVVLEEERLPDWAHPERALVLWVLAPSNKPLQGRPEPGEATPEDEQYTCPEYTLGHYYSAPTRVSLVDTNTKRVINTMTIKGGYQEEITIKDKGPDAYDIPYLIRPGYLYEVSGPLAKGEGKPHIFALRDFNGDGKALEFAFYWMESCNGAHALILGYSQKQDQIIFYPFLLEGDVASGHSHSYFWNFRFAKQKPIEPMHWRYEIFFNSGGSELFDFRYIPEREHFEGTVNWRK
jgi:hypothetical protein